MTDQNNKTNANGAGSPAPANKIDDKQTPAPRTDFKGTPVVNALPAVNGKPMLTFKLDDNIMPKVGDKVTITWGKIKRTGVVNRILQNNIVAIIGT